MYFTLSLPSQSSGFINNGNKSGSVRSDFLTSFKRHHAQHATASKMDVVRQSRENKTSKQHAGKCFFKKKKVLLTYLLVDPKNPALDIRIVVM